MREAIQHHTVDRGQGAWLVVVLCSTACATSASTAASATDTATLEVTTDVAASSDAAGSSDTHSTADGPSVDSAPCSAQLTWQDPIGPLLTQYCAGYCHAGGEEWSTCAKTQKKATTIKNYIKNGLMPPAGSPPMSEAERQLLYDWIANGKPCNATCP